MPSGLAGVVAVETVLSHTDRERGMLWVRGVALPDLVARHGYGGTVALLSEGFAGDGLRITARCCRHPARGVHAGVRGVALRRLAGACH